MSPSGPILIFLANGVQGSAVVRAARRRGHAVRALMRSRPSKDPTLAIAEIALGDLDNLESLIAATTGAAHVVLRVPIGQQADMVRQAGNALEAAKRANVRSLVLKLASVSCTPPCSEPSFVANAAIEEMVYNSDIPAAVVWPTMYLDNVLKPVALAEIMRTGTFAPPIPACQRIAWTSVDDCAEAAILLLEQDAYGDSHRIAVPESVNGGELAAKLSAGFGRTVTYRAQSLPEFEAEVDAAMRPGMGRRVASKFHYFEDHLEDAERVLATPWRGSVSLDDFIPKTIEQWARDQRDRFAL